MEEKEEVQTGETQAAEAAKEPDYRKMYEEQQSKVENLTRDLRQKEETLDAVTPYVDWAAASGQQTVTPEADSGEENYIDRKTMTEQLQKLQSSHNIQMAAMQFRIDNPDLKAYENTLVSPAVQRIIQKNPHLSQAEVLKRAATEVREFLEAERAKGKAEAEEKEEKRRKEVQKASGLGSSGETAPESDNEGETKEQYMARRRKRLEKMKQPTRVVG